VIQTTDRTVATAASDGDLVTAVRAGDPGAFEVLYARHWARVLGVCARRVPSADVEDIAQEVFERALTRLDTLADPERFGPWIRTIAVRACADILRSRSVDTPGDLPDLVDLVDPTAPLVDEVVGAREDARRLADGLAMLPPRDSHALWLRDALDTPVRLIAEDLGLTEASTRVLLARARQRLRAALAAVAAWVTGIVGIRREWLSGLVPANPATTVIAAASVAAVAVAITVPTAPVTPDPVPDVVVPAVDAGTDVMEADPATAEQVPADPVSVVPAPVPAGHGEQGGDSKDTSSPIEPVVTVEQQPVEDPEPAKATQVGDASDEFIVDIYDGGLVPDLLGPIGDRCLGSC